MMWILFVITWNGVVTIPFQTNEACMTAATKIINLPRVSSATCVERD